MKKLEILLIVLTSTILKINAQEQTHKTKPEEQIIVNKEYNKDGDLIGYDSTYINSWSGTDTSFNYSFDDQLIFGDSFEDINHLFEAFFGDSTIQNFGFPQNFQFEDFGADDFFKNFNRSYNDSVNLKNFNIDSIHNFQKQFEFPDMKQLQEQLKNFDFTPLLIPERLNEDQKRELRQLIQKHRKEIEELEKKWQHEH